MAKTQLQIPDASLAQMVFGERDLNLTEIERYFQIEIVPRGTNVTLQGKAQSCKLALRLLQEMLALAKKGISLSTQEVSQAARTIEENPAQGLRSLTMEQIGTNNKNQGVAPKSMNQKKYVEAIRNHDVVFSWGPAG